MKKNILALAVFIFLTMLATAGMASIMLWNQSGPAKVTASLTYTDQFTGRKTVRNYYNYSGLSTNFVEVYQDPANHFLFNIQSKQKDESGMQISITGVGSGISKMTSGVEVCASWVDGLPNTIQLADGVTMTDVKALIFKSSLTIGAASQCSGPINVVATGTVNYYGQILPARVTMTVPFVNVPGIPTDEYSSISRGTVVAANTPPQINQAIPTITIPFGGTTSVDLSSYISGKYVGPVTIDTISPNVNGTASGQGTLSLDYTAGDGFTGYDIYYVTARDAKNAQSNSAAVTFKVDPATVPIAQDKVKQFSKDLTVCPITIDGDLITNYDTCPGITVTPPSSTMFGKGTVSVSDGKINYSPLTGNPVELDYFTYSINKGTWNDTGTIVISPLP